MIRLAALFQREIGNRVYDGKKNQLARKVNAFKREMVCFAVV